MKTQPYAVKINVAAFSYRIFNRDIWIQNVNRFCFLFSLGLIYSFIRLALVDFQVSVFEVIGRFLS